MEEGDDDSDIYGSEASFGVNVKSRKRNMREARIAAQNRPIKLKILKKTQDSAATTRGDMVDVLLVEEHLRKTGFLSPNWLIHQRRAEGDIFYGLFFFPRSLAEVIDEESGETMRIELITKVCNDCIEYFEMRYGDCLTKDYMIRSIFAYLRTTTNTRIKLFSILYMITLESPLVRFLIETCGPTGFRKPSDYRRVASTMERFRHTLTHGTMVEQANISSIVDDTIRIATCAYLTPTNESNQSGPLSSTRTKR